MCSCIQLRNKWHRVQPFDSLNGMKLLTIFLLLPLFAPLVQAERLYYTIEQKQWGLATSAIRTKRTHEDFYSLTGDPMVPRAVKKQKASLYRGWRISSREDLIQKMEWIRNEGHRTEFEQILADREKSEWVVALRDRVLKKDRAHDYAYRHSFVDEVGDQSILAWDMGRLVALARWGVLCGYLEADEVWDWIMPAAQAIHESYSSWEELAEGYLVGRRFWSEYAVQEIGYKYERAAYWNLHNEFSPWTRFQWGMDLAGAEEPVAEDAELPEASDYFVAAHYDWGDQPKKALELLLQVKDDGGTFYRALAYDRLGTFYENGRAGISKDWNKAQEFYTAGAGLGDADCLYELGWAQYRGKGCLKDYGKAGEYWRAAADAGNVDGLTRIGMLYADGKGVDKDIDKAAEFYTEAARWGSNTSENNLAWLMYENPDLWDADEAVNLGYNAIHKWECNSHYDTLVNVLIKAERWSEAWRELNNWEKQSMRKRNNYDLLAIPDKYKRFRGILQAGLEPSS